MGSVVISIDAELGWGFHDLTSPPVERIENARSGWAQLQSLLDQYEVPATWAIVGHLFLSECDGTHADHPAPSDWFTREQECWRTRPDLRFGPDLVQDILDSPVNHEIASHSFSHVIFDDETTTPAVAKAEFEASKEVAREWGLTLDSFVFPRNRVNHLDLLAEAGFRCYRGPSVAKWDTNPVMRPANKFARATVLKPKPLVVDPYVDAFGLVNVPPSLFLFEFDGIARAVTERLWGDPVVRTVERGVEKVAEDGGVYHLWLHPNNLYRPHHAETMRGVLETIRERVETDEITVETIGDVADRLVGPRTPRKETDSRYVTA